MKRLGLLSLSLIAVSTASAQSIKPRPLGAVQATGLLFAKVSRTAAWLWLPYIIWVGFATVLNFSIWALNG